jgi:hypothetical protein
MATSAPPGMFDVRAVYRRVLKQLKIPSIDEILPNPMGAKESNPALENVSMTMGRPAAAYPDQDHISHIKIHLEYAKNPAYGANPVIGPTFAPNALEHIKQHLTLHYLQSMRAYVAQASGGRDELELHQEKPLTLESQQALALASQMVGEDANQILQPYVQQIQQLAQTVQQAQQAQMERIASQDPTAQVLLKTQMAETQRKQQESQLKTQIDQQKSQQDYELKLAELQRKVLELQSKYEVQTELDNQKNSTNVAINSMNNSSRERVAALQAQAQLSAQEVALAQEQAMLGIQAVNEAEKDIRQHGIEVERQQLINDADVTKQAIQAALQSKPTTGA